MAELALEGVRKRYPGGVEVLRGIDLVVADGEFLALVGPSGCGKSTLLSLIAGLDRQTSGHLRIDGRLVDDLEPRQRDVAMVFQSYALYPHMTVRRNLGFALEVARVDRAEIARRVEATARSLGLEALLDRKPRALSGGQRQRVAVGRALVRQPRLYLFDEPLSNLDPGLRSQVRGELKKLHEELRATFIYVTHDQAESMTLADRVVVLDAGVVQQAAPPREVYARPANLFVARFFGMPPINLFTRDGEQLGIRPEHVTVGVGTPPEGALGGIVYLVEPLGSDTWVTVELSDGVRLTGRAPADFAESPGTPAWLRLEEARLLRFDAGSGRRK
jgi:multiple sugar transport system ATP-binding protein